MAAISQSAGQGFDYHHKTRSVYVYNDIRYNDITVVSLVLYVCI